MDKPTDTPIGYVCSAVQMSAVQMSVQMSMSVLKKRENFFFFCDFSYVQAVSGQEWQIVLVGPQS